MQISWIYFKASDLNAENFLAQLQHNLALRYIAFHTSPVEDSLTHLGALNSF